MFGSFLLLCAPFAVKSSMKKYAHLIMLAAMFALFCVSRVATLLSAGSLWFDEAFSAHVATLPWNEAQAMLAYEHNPWLPFLLWRLVAFFSPSDLAFRLPSLIAGMCSFGLVALISWRLWQSKAAMLGTSFLFTLSSLLLYHQTEARMYSLVVLFALAMVAASFEWLRQPSRWMLMVSAIATVALVHTHLTAWLPAAIVIALVAFEARQQSRPIYVYLACHAAAFVSGFIWLIPVIYHRISVAAVSQGWFFSQNSDSFFGPHLVNLLLNGEPRLLPRVLAGIILCILLCAALVSDLRTHKITPDRPSLDLALWLAGIFAAGLALQTPVTKYLMIAVIPVMLLAGLGFSKLPRRIAIALAAVLFVIAAPMHAHLLGKRHHWDEAAQRVAALQAQYDDQVTIAHSFIAALPLQRYLPAGHEVIPFIPLDGALTLDQAISRYNWLPIIDQTNIERLDALSANKGHIILVSTTVASNESDPVKARLWQQGWKLLERYTYSGYGDPEILLFAKP